MITRPLGFADRLRPAPRSFDGLFFANAVLLGLYFAFFGSRFVISPGIEVENPEFRVPTAVGAVADGRRTSFVIQLPRPGVAFTPEGQQTLPRLGEWLKRRAERRAGGRVLVVADASVPMQDVMDVFELVRAAGYDVQLAAQPPATTVPPGR